MGFTIYVGIWIIQIIMSKNLRFKTQKKLFMIVMRQDVNRWQKYILQQKKLGHFPMRKLLTKCRNLFISNKGNHLDYRVNGTQK